MTNFLCLDSPYILFTHTNIISVVLPKQFKGVVFLFGLLPFEEFNELFKSFC